jgi:cephalosporin hydroxylase
MLVRRLLKRVYLRFFSSTVHSWFFRDLLEKTNGFATTSWLGTPICQNMLDLWTIQKTRASVRQVGFAESL